MATILRDSLGLLKFDVGPRSCVLHVHLKSLSHLYGFMAHHSIPQNPHHRERTTVVDTLPRDPPTYLPTPPSHLGVMPRPGGYGVFKTRPRRDTWHTHAQHTHAQHMHAQTHAHAHPHVFDTQNQKRIAQEHV